MKKLLPFIVIGLFIGCISNEKEVCYKGLPDKNYAFLNDIKRQPNQDYLETIVDFRQFGSYSENKWIRKPKNIKLLYGSLKAVGLKKFISNKEFNKPLFTDHWKETCWADKSLNQILENLIVSFSDTTGIDKYYVEFWNRRKNEKNESVVLKVFQDIQKEYNSESNIEKSNWPTESKIVGLMDFEIKLKHSNSTNLKQVNIEYFDYLKSIGLYNSANNLIQYAKETKYNSTEVFDKDYLELIRKIETDSVDCGNYWNWRQSANWFIDVYDYGP